jgi:protein O-GlcNAc transferase
MSQSLSKVLQAEALFRQGDADGARALLTRALHTKPNDAEACNLLALILDATGDRERAVVFAERAHSLNSRDWRFVNNLATILSRRGKRAKAIDILRKGAAAIPDNADLHAALASELSIDSQFVAAAAQARAGLSRSPHHARLASALISILVEMGRSAEAVEVAKAAARNHPDSPLLASQLCHAMNYLPGVTRDDVLAAHNSFGSLLERVFPAKQQSFTNDTSLVRKLRVAIVSGDLRTHSCSYFIESFLRLHDRESIELYCYHTAVGDEVTQRFVPLAHAWRDCAGVSDSALADTIRADAIDVALDLSAHTCAATLLAFHARVAPVQITYLAYPNTTGVRAMDYRIVDSHTDPIGSERWCRESLLRIDPCFLCYSPPINAPAVAPPPSQAPRPGSPTGDGVIRFGSFNAAAKLSPEALALWGKVLAAVPNSRLVLKASSFIDPLLRDEVRARLVSWGAPADRLDILSPAMATSDHLGMYSTIDIALDPFPYHGTTTTLEALHMGVPVVTLACDRHASRVGVSLLSAVGVQECIATSPDQYVQIAADLARDRARLARWRGDLRARLAASPLCDAAAHTRRLEGAIRSAWSSCGARS